MSENHGENSDMHRQNPRPSGLGRFRLFSQADPNAVAFQRALTKYFDGQPDRRTLELIAN